jgi:hypothetical protein
MHFLINDSDKSVNYFSEEPIPEFMNHSGTTLIEASIDHLPPETDLTTCFYDSENNTIILDPKGIRIPMTAQELQEFIDQQQLLQQAITSAETDKFNKLVAALATLFPDNAAIQEILSDNTVSADELQQIEDMLNQNT